MSKRLDKTEAKSICACGHTGDGKHSDHGGFQGHGPCIVENCMCVKFTWSRYMTMEEQQEHIAQGIRLSRG